MKYNPLKNITALKTFFLGMLLSIKMSNELIKPFWIGAEMDEVNIRQRSEAFKFSGSTMGGEFYLRYSF